MKTFCLGDIHGAYQALMECLKLSGFDKTKDRLICLGDVCDRGPQVKECIDELLTIPVCVYILGNHDAWALQWAVTGEIIPEWWNQGGAQTANSYKGSMPAAHIQFLKDARLYHVEHNRLFVHGGFDPSLPIEKNPKEVLIWDRSLLKNAEEVQQRDPSHKFGGYEEVFVGHTPTTHFGRVKPQHFCNVWALDTGAGWGASLTIMDIETKKFWQSKAVNLYA